MQALPIDPLLPEVTDALRRGTGLVLEAPPGAGKTTRVPRALLDAGFAERGEIVVLEPRRLAARMAARRVAEELGEEVGGTVGYQVRFEDVSSARTRVRFVTEGTLTRRLLRDRELAGVAVVLLDEFHERHLDGDLALALLRRLQLGPRPDLRVGAMSATLEAGPVAEFLGAPRLRSEGRLFEIAVEHLEQKDDRPLESQVASAVRRLVDEGLDGDVLVFLPGALEIRRATDACAKVARDADLLVLPLHGSLPPAEQDRAVRRADRRKVILSTNVAETSVTIDGVVAVVDSGLARVAHHSPWSGLPTLRVAKVSRASATQRAGRAGRTRPGRCLRLYTRGDLLARPEHDAPEVARADLAEAALQLVAAGVDPATFAWFEPPPTAAREAATTLLGRLGAIEAGGLGGGAPHRATLTSTGARMLRFPLHPRLARLVVEGERRGIAREAATLAALLDERDLATGSPHRAKDARHRSDVLDALERFDEAEAVGFSPERLRWMGIDAGRAAAVDRTRKQLARLVDTRAAPVPGSPARWEEAALIAVLAGFPDRVGRLRRPANATGRSAREIVLAGGGTAALSEASGVAEVDLVVAVDVEERSEHTGTRSRAVVRVASAVEPDWLLDLFTDAVRDTTEATWNAAAERVEVVRRLSYDGLVLEETRGAQGDPAEVARVLAEAVRAKGWRAFARGDDVDQWLLRAALVRQHCPELGLPALDEAGIEAMLASLCEGSRSFADLKDHDLGAKLRAELGAVNARAIDELAPEHVALPGGRRLRVTYAEGAAPSVESRLQDFFGMRQGPAIARGRVPVVIHLLAPNHRDVQVTTDLAGFWSRHYPAIAKELRRRYPRHAWPDDPLTAAPPAPRR
jgi:ATP-dependent helicase HrpB